MAYQENGKRTKLEQRVSNGWAALIAMLVCTAVNLVFLLMNSTTYLLFSASVPYYMTWFGRIMDNGTMDGTGDIIGTYTNTALVMAVAILAVYVLCTIFYRKSRFLMATAAVLFLVDCLGLAGVAVFLLEDPSEVILDAILHLWVLWRLFSALFAAGSLKKLPPPVPQAPGNDQGWPVQQPPRGVGQMSWDDYQAARQGYAPPSQPPQRPSQPWDDTYQQPQQPQQPWDSPRRDPAQDPWESWKEPEEPQRRSTTPEMDEQKPWEP